VPNPSREQFEAAAQKVMQSAPPGLSREQFFALIDQQISKDASLPEPPSTRGFLGNVVESGLNTASDLITGVPKLAMRFWENPEKLGGDIVAGVTGRAKELYNDPLGTIYRDPVGVAADVAGVGSLAKLGFKTATAARPIAAAGREAYNSPAMRTQRAVRDYVPTPSTVKPPGPMGAREPMMGPEIPPPISGRPDMVPRGGEGAYNETMPQAAAPPLADDIAYEATMRKLHGPGWKPRGEDVGPPAGTPERRGQITATTAAPAPVEQPIQRGERAGDSYINHLRSTEPPDLEEWHSGATPGSPEARQWSGIHKTGAEMDADYQRRIKDQRGMVVPDLLLGMFLEELGRRYGVGRMGRMAVRAAPRLAKPLMRMPVDPGLLGRFTGLGMEQEQEK